MIQQITEQRYYISKGTPFPFCCPVCNSIIPVASINGEFAGVDRFKDIQTCISCNYQGLTEEFDCEWEFKEPN